MNLNTYYQFKFCTNAKSDGPICFLDDTHFRWNSGDYMRINTEPDVYNLSITFDDDTEYNFDEYMPIIFHKKIIT